jgi:hypothetical protein
MKRRKLRTRSLIGGWCALAAISIAFQPAAASCGQPDAKLEVALASEKAEYLLAEPVRLVVTVKNAGDETLEFRQVLVDVGIPEIFLFLSRDGDSFRKCVWGTSRAHVWVGRTVEKLAPEASKRYDLYVLYEYASESRMAFDAAGPYWLKVIFPLNTRKPSEGYRFRPIESNVLRIEIKKPEGLDAEAYETIRRPELLYFLQTPSLEPGREKAAVDAARLYQWIHGSTYDAPVRQALLAYYDARRKELGFKESQADPDMTELRSVLGIFEPPPGPFPDDPRLDVMITYHFPEFTPLSQVLAEISSATGVPLSVSPELAERKNKSLQVTTSLREFMFARAVRDAKWVPRGKGYLLVPAPKTLPPAVRGRVEGQE